MAAGPSDLAGVGGVECPYRIINCLESEVCANALEESNSGGANGKIRKGGWQERQERNAPSKAWHASLGPRRERRRGQEPEAGHCHRPLRSPEEGSKGPAKALELVVAAPAGAGVTSFQLQAGEGAILMKNPTP